MLCVRQDECFGGERQLLGPQFPPQSTDIAEFRSSPSDDGPHFYRSVHPSILSRRENLNRNTSSRAFAGEVSNERFGPALALDIPIGRCRDNNCRANALRGHHPPLRTIPRSLRAVEARRVPLLVSR